MLWGVRGVQKVRRIERVEKVERRWWRRKLEIKGYKRLWKGNESMVKCML